MKNLKILIITFLSIFINLTLINCQSGSTQSNNLVNPKDDDSLKNEEPVLGCDGQEYVLPENSPYILPFPVGLTYDTGLSNCSSSYHSSGQPDAYAFDFNMPLNDIFIASRGGTVHSVEDSGPKDGIFLPKTNIVGNYVIIDHGDNTFGIYLHSPDQGIFVKTDDIIQQGDTLGLVGKSGLAGYPHLHFIVVKGAPVYPYDGIPISFKNALPNDVIIKSYSTYTAGEY